MFYFFYLPVLLFANNILIFVSDYGVTAALLRRLVKGNPVRVRNYTRSCKFFDAQAVNSHCSSMEWEGAWVNKSENLPYSLCFIQTPGKGFINVVYVADF